MKKKRKLPDKNSSLLNAICWTFITVMWVITLTLNPRFETPLPYIQVAVILLSALSAILNWRRWAAHKEENS